jgi:Sulfotransferase family
MAARPPVFIVGSPRSGTTLLRKVLDRHPALAICGETRFYRDVYARRRIFGDLNNLRNRRRLVEQYLSTVRAKRIGVDPARLGTRLLNDANSYRALFTCILEYYAETQGKKRGGEKTPHHAFFTETLCEWFPGAAIIHLVRDPRDVVASLQLQRWAPSSVVNNAWMWVLFNRGARRSSHRPEYLLVHYEKLVAHPEQELARICAHVGEDYAASMLAPADAAAGPYSWPQHASGTITTERLEKWREQLDAKEVSLVEWVAGRNLLTYSYQRSGPPPSIATIARGLALAGLDPVRRHLGQLPYLWYRFLRPTKLSAQEYWKHPRLREQTAPESKGAGSSTSAGR